MREDQIQAIAAVNSGSSTLKFGLFSCDEPLQTILKGRITGIGSSNCLFTIESSKNHNDFCNPANIDSTEKAAELVVQWLQLHSRQYRINSIGHRIVHGGLQFRNPEQIDNGFLEELKSLETLAPLHLPDAISIVTVFKEKFPDIPQIACFDTAFHWQMPFEARHYAIPRQYWEEGIIRYGFHGISCEYIWQQLQKVDERIDSKKIIIAHLGSGSSMTAIKNGTGIENTMGFTPAGGMIMNTRAGDIDPGVIIYLLKEKKMSPEKLEDLFNKRSGLKAIAGSDASMEKLLEQEQTNPQAEEAVLMYCYHAKKQIGALAAALGGLDILVFTGGIGEHSAVIRCRICGDLGFLGLEINEALNHQNAETITELPSRVQVYVIPANEEMIIARHAKEYVRQYQ